MSENKLMKGIMIGAAVGAGFALMDRKTRQDVKTSTRELSSNVKYYASNRDELKMMLQEKLDTVQSMYSQFSQDAQYLQQKFGEVKQLTPQVKSLVSDTKEAFTESKEEYKSIVGVDGEANDVFEMPVLPEHEYDPNKYQN